MCAETANLMLHFGQEVLYGVVPPQLIPTVPEACLHPRRVVEVGMWMHALLQIAAGRLWLGEPLWPHIGNLPGCIAARREAIDNPTLRLFRPPAYAHKIYVLLRFAVQMGEWKRLFLSGFLHADAVGGPGGETQSRGHGAEAALLDPGVPTPRGVLMPASVRLCGVAVYDSMREARAARGAHRMVARTCGISLMLRRLFNDCGMLADARVLQHEQPSVEGAWRLIMK